MRWRGPGRLHRVGERLTAPAPLDRATAAVLLTLVDNETPLWLDAAARCGARLAGIPLRRRDHRCAGRGGVRCWRCRCRILTALSAGTHEAPESSATLILQVTALGTGARYRLSGPGLREPAVLAVDGLPADFVAALAAATTRCIRAASTSCCAPARR